MYTNNYARDSDIDKENRDKIIAKKIALLRNINSTELITNFLTDSSEIFQQLLRLYEKLEPRWVDKYNSYEKKKPIKMQTILSRNTTIEDMIYESEGDELMESALTTVVSNRIAHTIEHIIKKKIEEYLINNKKSFNPSDIVEIKKKMMQYFDSANEQSKILPRVEKFFTSKGIDINAFNKEEMQVLVESQKTFFTLKDFSIMQMLNNLKDREDINYGKRTDQLRETETLAVDLPFYGQFCVHLRLPDIGKQLTDRDIPEYSSQDKSMEYEEVKDVSAARRLIAELLKDKYYKGAFYEIENVMLTSQSSKETAEFLATLSAYTEDEQIEKIRERAGNDDRYYKFLLIKGGYDTRGENDGNESR